MGFEVTFAYSKKKDDGSYDKEAEKTFIKKIGTSEEETPLEEVAKVVMGQLARRDIWVNSVAISEFIRKKIKFKEIKYGIIIKDKKFIFEQIACNVVCENEDKFENIPTAKAMFNSDNSIKFSTAKPIFQPDTIESNSSLKPIRFEMYDPNPLLKAKLGNRARLTVGKKYPVLKEYTDAKKETYYVIRDDVGLETTIGAEYFVVSGAGLSWGFEAEQESTKQNLSFQGQFIEDKMSVIKRG